MDANTAAQDCQNCRKRFVPQFRFQVDQTTAGAVYYCSQKCRMALSGAATRQLVNCSVCSQSFALAFAYQTALAAEGRRYFCSQACLAAETQAQEAAQAPSVVARAIAVLNQKGGTAKTTTAVNIAAGLAQIGKRVLLVDLDTQGNVGVSLGVKGAKSIYHVLFQGASLVECSVPVRDNLDIITSDQTLSLAERELAKREKHAHSFNPHFAKLRDYDYVILDCAPSSSLMNQNALTYVHEVLVPVSCDYLSLVGVKQVIKTIQYVNENLMHPVKICGVLPTFFDVRNRISVDAVNNLRSYFKERTLPPIRVNTKLKEAPSVKKTIFEHAPDSNGARDYARVVEWIDQIHTLTPLEEAPVSGRSSKVNLIQQMMEEEAAG